MTIGERIRNRRVDLGWTQRTLAVNLCMSGYAATPQDVMRWETDRNMPCVPAMLKLVDVLGISLDWLIRGIEPVCAVAVADDGHSEC